VLEKDTTTIGTITQELVATEEVLWILIRDSVRDSGLNPELWGLSTQNPMPSRSPHSSESQSHHLSTH
jgi:hypothetical protein